MKWKPLWDWAKKVGGVVLTAIVTPYVTAKYGPGWGAVVGTAGAAAAHQARRFGDGKKLNKKTDIAEVKP